jgi:pimeloyl-ACP methyl ester carboxylesterase
MMKLFALPLAASLALAASAAAQTTPAPAAAPDPYAPGREIIRDIDRVVTPRGVQETFEVTLGGARQIVSVRGADRDNPIILFVHGGPGAVEMPMAWTFERPWEDFFTVVQWDQRGAGKSYPLNDPKTLAPTLKPDRYRDDTIELIEVLRRKYGKRKIILMGHSWGSIVGLSVAAKRPDLLYAYVGVGQMIDVRANEQIGYDWTLAQARKAGNTEAIRELEAIAPYPGNDALDIAKMDTERKWSIRYGALAAGRDNADFYFNSSSLSPDYSPADIQAWSDGSKFTMDTMFGELASISFEPIRKLDVPVILLLGRHDYTVAAPIAASWMTRLQAPQKKLVWFENSAHLPMIEEPGHMLQALLDDVRPLTQEQRK